MRLTLILLAAAMGLVACGTGDGDGGGSGGGTGSSGLAGLLKGFGKAATGSNGGSGGGGIGDTDGGLPIGGSGGGGAGTADCRNICERVIGCISEGGCPNFARLPREQTDQVMAQCVPACQQGLTQEALDEVNSATCADIYREISAGEADVQAFCALEPASDADCNAFCQLLSMCGGEVTDELCRLTCLYGDGVRCIVQNGTCNAPECGQYFPSE